MAMVLFCSVAGSPGVTTAAIAAGVHWRRPAAVVEADIANVGSIMTGYFRAALDTAAGMQTLSFALTRGVLDADAILDPTLGLSVAVHSLPPISRTPLPALPAGHRLWVVPGFRELGIVAGVHALWRSLPALAGDLDARGVDLVVDLGRLGVDDVRGLLLDAADLTLILATRSISDLNRLHKRLRLPDLADRIRAARQRRFALLLVDSPTETVPVADFRQNVLPVLARLPFDPVGAAVFAHGSPDPRPARNAYRAAARRAALTLTDQLIADRPMPVREAI